MMKLSMLTALGIVFLGGAAADAARWSNRCAPRTGYRYPATVQAAPNQGYYVQDAQGNYRRYSVEPGEEGVTPVVPSQSQVPVPQATSPSRSGTSTNDHRSIENRRWRPGTSFR